MSTISRGFARVRSNALSALFLAFLTASAIAKPPTEPLFTPGGTQGIVRAKWTVVATTKDSLNRPAIELPRPETVYVLPLSVESWREDENFALWPDGTIEVKQPGLYSITANVDWVAQDGSDSNLRKVTIAKLMPGADLGTKWESGLLNVQSKAASYWRLAAADIPGSAVPTYCTGQILGFVTPTLEPGAYAVTDVPVACAQPGDIPQAAYSSLGYDADMIAIGARVVAPGSVRVRIANFSPVAWTPQPGTLNVMSGSAALSAGRSTDGWHTISSAPEQLNAGDRIFATVRSLVPGAKFQATNMTSVQITRWAVGVQQAQGKRR